MTNVRKIPQPEPLFTVRSREILPGRDGVPTRGERSRMRLLNRSSGGGLSGIPEAGEAFHKLTQTQTEPGFQDFLLIKHSISFQERHQIHHPIGDSEVVNFFGKGSVYIDLQGLVVDDVDNQWFPQFADAYDKYLRGSQLAKQKALLQLDMPSLSVVGSILNLSMSRDASRKVDVFFQMRMLVREHKYTSLSQGLEGTPSAIPEGLNDFITGPLGQVSGTLSDRVGKVRKQSEAFMDPVRAGIQRATGGLNAAKETSTTITGTASTTFNGIKSYVQDFFGRMNEYLSTAKNFTGNITGGANDFIDSILGPVNEVISGGRSIAGEVTSIIKEVEGGYRGAISSVASVISGARNLADILRDTAGLISYFPQDFVQTLEGLIQNGKLSGAVFEGGSLASNSESPLLGVGRGNNPSLGAFIGNESLDEAVLRNATSSYDPSKGAGL